MWESEWGAKVTRFDTASGRSSEGCYRAGVLKVPPLLRGGGCLQNGGKSLTCIEDMAGGEGVGERTIGA